MLCFHYVNKVFQEIFAFLELRIGSEIEVEEDNKTNRKQRIQSLPSCSGYSR
ncbi:unnamed protein product [Brugia timori]|uniref:Uncharacterized protein n=1 Tax=Brugia timori TaxID=42155 RepID=A0A0R3QC31_9BILA|nr:unnamed protein product [Brugia timori]